MKADLPPQSFAALGFVEHQKVGFKHLMLGLFSALGASFLWLCHMDPTDLFCPERSSGEENSQRQGWLPLLQVPKPQRDQEKEKEGKHRQTWHIFSTSRGNLILLRRGRWVLNPRWNCYIEFNVRFIYLLILSLSVDAGIFSIVP